ncbi:MAG: hypothetical protein FD146_1068 [Anaerolineaceae bacterium]|nr:MAG: hypothetical protein FD146_1068 [Anaerolineaceae bacterium]
MPLCMGFVERHDRLRARAGGSALLLSVLEIIIGRIVFNLMQPDTEEIKNVEVIS